MVRMNVNDPNELAERNTAVWVEPDGDRLPVRRLSVTATVEANGVTLGVEHFGDAAAPLVLLAGGRSPAAVAPARAGTG